MTAPAVHVADSGDVVLVLGRQQVRALAALLESGVRAGAPPASDGDLRLLSMLRHAGAVGAARMATAALEVPTGDTPCSTASSWRAAAVVERPFGDELTTDEAASALEVAPRTVRRWCHLDTRHPHYLRCREVERGAFRVSGVDVERLRMSRPGA